MSAPSLMLSATSGEGKGWKLVTSSTKRKDLAPSKDLQVQNRYTTLKGEEELDMSSSKGSGPPLVHRKSLVRGKEVQEWQKGGSGNSVIWNKV